jgi:predicted Zn-dependent protease with MMP-like domain
MFALLLALVVSGCGDQSPKEKADLGQARSIVERFAAAHDASACDLLTATALKDIYGNFKGAKAKAKANCVKKATGFKGDQITIIRSELLDNLTAKVIAHSSDEKFSFSVNLRRVAAGKPWRIDSISQAKLT